MSAISTVGIEDKGFDLEAYLKDPVAGWKEIENHYKGAHPPGHVLAVRMCNLTDKILSRTAGGIYIADESKANAQWDSTLITPVGLVVQVGADAYADKGAYPNGAYCKPGQFVAFGQRIKGAPLCIKGWTTLFIDADCVDYVIDDPNEMNPLSITRILK